MSLRMTPFANVKTVQNLKSFKMSNYLNVKQSNCQIVYKIK